MPCPSCAAENQPTHRYCHSCGVSLTAPTNCPNCGSEIQASYRFCGKCGFSLSAGFATPTPREIPAVPVSACLRRLWNGVDSRLDRAQSALRLTPDDDLRIPLTLEVGIVAVLTLIALFLRVHDLWGESPGIYHDEVRSTMLVRRILSEGWIGVFFRGNAGMGTGTHYLATPYFVLGGQTLEMWRLSIAMFGVAFVPMAHLLVRQFFNARISLLTTALVTFSVWHVMQSRIGWDVMPSLFFFAAGIYALMVSLRSRNLWGAALAGVIFAVGLYTNKAFFFYYIGVLAVIIGTIAVNPPMRRRTELYSFIAASVIIGFAMIRFYLFSDYSLTDAAGYYGISLSNLPFEAAKYAANAWNLFLLVHNSMHAPQAEGAGGIPMLRPFVTEIFFWVGLAITLLSVNKRPYQLLLLGWLIAMVPSVILPDGEARRYTLGSFYLLVIASIGFYATLTMLIGRVRGTAQQERTAPYMRRLVTGAAIIGMAVFIILFAASNRVHFDNWKNHAARWHFDYEMTLAARYLQSVDGYENYEVRMYSRRWPVDHITIEYLLPELRGIDGSTEFGGNGALPSEDPITHDTIFLFLDQYIPLAEQMQAAYPRASKIAERVDDGKLVYVAYLVPPPPN